jgi:hypothetical protein
MGRIALMNHVTLDGSCRVRDAPTRTPEANSRWAGGSTVDRAGRCGRMAMGERMAAGGGLIGWLFGKWTYEQLLSYWNRQPYNPFTPALNSTPKYVVSTSLTEPLAWPNSTFCVKTSSTRLAPFRISPMGSSRSCALVDQLAGGGRPDRRVLADDPPVGTRHLAATVPERCRSEVVPYRQRHDAQRRGRCDLRAREGPYVKEVSC